jgi:hypothetical protein
MTPQEFEAEMGRAITDDEISIMEMLMRVPDMSINAVATNMECTLDRAFELVLPLWQLYLVWYPKTLFFVGLTDKGRTLYRHVRRKTDNPRPQVFGW